MTAVMLWLIVGIYGNILKSGHIVEGLVWLSCQLNVNGSAFTVAAFIFLLFLQWLLDLVLVLYQQ